MVFETMLQVEIDVGRRDGEGSGVRFPQGLLEKEFLDVRLYDHPTLRCFQGRLCIVKEGEAS